MTKYKSERAMSELNFVEQVAKILQLKKEKSEWCKLPSGCAYLTDNIILAYPQESGNSRYPYSCDGRTLWAYSSGDIVMQEGLFTIFPDTTRGQEPVCAFFIGDEACGHYVPVSVTGAASGLCDAVERFVVFTPEAAFYCTLTKKDMVVLRIFMDKQKNTYFSVYIKNITAKEHNTYLAAFFNPLLTHGAVEGFWDKCYRTGKVTEHGFLLETKEYLSGNRVNHYAVLESDAGEECKTTSRTQFMGGVNRQLSASIPLQTGAWQGDKKVTAFSETAVFGELRPFALAAGEEKTFHYKFSITQDVALLNVKTNCINADRAFIQNVSVTGYVNADNTFSVKGAVDAFAPYAEVFTPFLNNVVRQVAFCTLSKNYAGHMIGMRDIFQQIQGSIPTMPQYCRKKMLEALSYIGEDGRVPRQYSYGQAEGALPAMDLREFIDQGVWIIATVYTYLQYTDDWMFLYEECGYYKFEGRDVKFSKRRDDVLSHLVSVADYLVANIDPATDCLCALYGDWNDALDGLGKTDKQQPFGNGVSVMASLQLYQNLEQLCAIFKHEGKYSEKFAAYQSVRERLKKGLIQNAVIKSANGSKKILHGWGDDRSYYVGSDCDGDGACRDGLTSYAFWVLSDLFFETSAISTEDICSAYRRLDSKYGLKTFEPYFPESFTEVGRIGRLPKGTAENGATYIHATLFGILSLFKLKEYSFAWEQLYKILPFTHKSLSTSPFVMSNSYAYNPELGLDGQSISDWYTGSGCVLLKIFYDEIFGIKPDANGVWFDPAKITPFQKATAIIQVKGMPLTINIFYGTSSNEKKFVWQGQEYFTSAFYLPTEQLKEDKNEIRIYL